MRSMMKKIRRTAMVAAAGAGIAYLLDPQQGAERREMILSRLRTIADSSSDGGRPPFGDQSAQPTSATSVPPVDHSTPAETDVVGAESVLS